MLLVGQTDNSKALTCGCGSQRWRTLLCALTVLSHGTMPKLASLLRAVGHEQRWWEALELLKHLWHRKERDVRWCPMMSDDVRMWNGNWSKSRMCPHALAFSSLQKSPLDKAVYRSIIERYWTLFLEVKLIDRHQTWQAWTHHIGWCAGQGPRSTCCGILMSKA